MMDVELEYLDPNPYDYDEMKKMLMLNMGYYTRNTLRGTLTLKFIQV